MLTRRNFLIAAGVCLSLPWLETLAAAEKPTAPLGRAVFFMVPSGVNMWRWHPKEFGTNFQMSSTLAALTPFRKELTIFYGLEYARGRAADTTRSVSGSPATRNTGARTARSSRTRSRSIRTSRARSATARASPAWFSAPREAASPRRSTPRGRRSTPRTNCAGSSASCSARPTCSRVSNVAPAFSTWSANRRRGSRSNWARTTASVSTIICKAFARWKAGCRPTAVTFRPNRWRSRPTVSSWMSIHNPSARITFEPCSSWSPSRCATTRRVVSILACGSGYEFFGTWAEFGPGTHHRASHATNFDTEAQRPKDFAFLEGVDKWFIAHLACFLERLDETKEGDSTLLASTMVLYGGGISWSHNPSNLPMLLAGGSRLGLKHGSHLRFNPHKDAMGKCDRSAKVEETTVCDVLRTISERVGVPAERFGDSRRVVKQVLAS